MCGFTRTHLQLGVLRFWAGIAASAPLGLSQVVIAEMWGTQRGRPLCLLSLAGIIGPCIGSIIGEWEIYYTSSSKTP